MDYTVHGIFQASILEQVAFPFSRGSSQPRNRIGISCIAGGFFTKWAIREATWSHLNSAKYIWNNPISKGDILRYWGLGLQHSFVGTQLKLCFSVLMTPWTAVCQPSLSFTISWSLLKLLSIELVILSNHLILYHPIFLYSIFPRTRVFSNDLALCIRWLNYSTHNHYKIRISFLWSKQKYKHTHTHTHIYAYNYTIWEIWYGSTCPTFHHFVFLLW